MLRAIKALGAQLIVPKGAKQFTDEYVGLFWWRSGEVSHVSGHEVDVFTLPVGFQSALKEGERGKTHECMFFSKRGFLLLSKAVESFG